MLNEAVDETKRMNIPRQNNKMWSINHEIATTSIHANHMVNTKSNNNITSQYSTHNSGMHNLSEVSSLP
jgi:hypothetical protein